MNNSIFNHLEFSSYAFNSDAVEDIIMRGLTSNGDINERDDFANSYIMFDDDEQCITINVPTVEVMDETEFLDASTDYTFEIYYDNRKATMYLIATRKLDYELANYVDLNDYIIETNDLYKMGQAISEYIERDY